MSLFTMRQHVFVGEVLSQRECTDVYCVTKMALLFHNAFGSDSNDYEIDECSLSSLRFHLSKYVGHYSLCSEI